MQPRSAVFTGPSKTRLVVTICLADEIVEKELAVHKEMVIELRRQLEEKESDLQVGVRWEGKLLSLSLSSPPPSTPFYLPLFLPLS